MKRRHFLFAPVLTAPLLSFANYITRPFSRSADKALVVRNGESRFFSKNSNASSNYGRCIISSRDMQNQLYIAGGARDSYLKKGGPALHIQAQDDEIFYVVSG